MAHRERIVHVVGAPDFVNEVVVERAPPSHKTWRIEGPVRLIIMGAYAMGFDLVPERDGSRLRVWISYETPAGVWGWLARPLTALYAR
jgi:hypothetical protein